MLNVSRPWSVRTLLFSLCLLPGLNAATAYAQALPESGLQRQLDRLELGAVANGQITGGVTGTNALSPPNQKSLTQDASTTVGVLGTLRYVKSPLVGFEANYSFARYTENFSSYIIGGAQTRVNEYSLGYVAHLPSILGVEPYAAVGAGTIAFHPTAGGGQGLPFQYRAGYYYNIGADKAMLFKNFGVRLQFRQVFFKAPDFGQNYLTIQQRTSTLEPAIGFFLKF